QIVLFAHADLGSVQDSLGTTFESEQHIDVVVQLATFHKRSDVGGEFLDLQAGDVFGQIFGMGADIADTPPCSAPFRVGAPGGLFLTRGFDASSEPALRVFHHYFADLA